MGVVATAVDATDLRRAGGAMLAAALALPALPGRPHLFCPLRTLTGVPCPLCGMTTSVEATMHLHLGHALAANPAGPLVVGLAALLLVRRPATVRVRLPVVVLALALMWAFELHRFGFLR
jgi:hypothetical protein